MKKISKIVVQVVVSEYDDKGDLVDEQVSQPTPIYRAKTQDVWAYLDDKIKVGE